MVPVAILGPPLDERQQHAAEYGGQALLVIAGAGTGKTRTVVSRLAWLLRRGADPDRILLMTFSRRAAEEMVRRLAAVVGPAEARAVRAGTFHSVAHGLLQRHSSSLGLGPGFSVVDPGDVADLMHMGRQEVLDGDGERRRFPRKETLVSLYSRVVNSQVPLRDVIRRHFPWVAEHEARIAAVFGWYADRKRERALLDFDDLLLYWRAAMTDPVLGPAVAGQFDHLLIDEYQDTNLLQASIVAAFYAEGCSVTAVGDDAQAIYGFRAASVGHILAFPEQYPEAEVVRLERNYRSTQPVLDVANAVLAEATEGYAKCLWSDRTGGGRPVLATCPDEAAEAEAVAETVLELQERGVALREQAVLFRGRSTAACWSWS